MLALADATNNLTEDDPVLREIERERKALYASNRQLAKTKRENDARLAELAEKAAERRTILKQSTK